jgi:hypothetical protein
MTVQVPLQPLKEKRDKDQVSLNLKKRAVHTQLSFFKMINPNPTTILSIVVFISLFGDVAAIPPDMSDEALVSVVAIAGIKSLF